MGRATGCEVVKRGTERSEEDEQPSGGWLGWREEEEEDWTGLAWSEKELLSVSGAGATPQLLITALDLSGTVLPAGRKIQWQRQVHPAGWLGGTGGRACPRLRTSNGVPPCF